MKECLNDYIEAHFDELVSDIQEFISIESTLDDATSGKNAPFGKGIQKALEFALAKAKDMGFYTKNIDGYAGYAQMGDAGEQVAILAHADVVPANGEWDVPPYGAQIVDGKLYGRGSVDDKGPAMACLYAMKAIKECGLPFSKHVRWLLGTDEETLARGIHYYLEREEAPAYGFSPDAEFPIIHAEKGTLRFQFVLPCGDKDIVFADAGVRLNVVPDFACAGLVGISPEEVAGCADRMALPASVTAKSGEGKTIVEVRGLSSHASYPEEGINAIQNLFLLLCELYPNPDTDTKRTLHALKDALKMETDGASAGVACSDSISGELTLNTAVLKIGEEENICKFDIRYPVTYDGEQLIQKLRRLGEKAGVQYETIQHKPPLYVEKDTLFIKKLQKAYEECTGQKAECISIGGGTYCRYVKNTVSFGPVFPGQKELAHQANEYIQLEDLKKMTKIYAQAIYNLIE